MKTITQIQKAYGLGADAFLAGKNAVPAQDPTFRKFLKENDVRIGEGEELIHLWIKGFVEA